MSPAYGEVVGVRTRQGQVDCVVVETRRVSRGRQAGKVEYKLAPLAPVDKAYAFNAIGDQFFGPPSRSYPAKDIQAAVARCQETREKVFEAKEERKERGREAIGDVDWKKTRVEGKASGTKIAVGDEVLVRYTDRTRWERVVEVNLKTGKVGIARNKDDSSDALMSDLAAIFGTRRTVSRDVRWIHPDHVKETRSPQKGFPGTLGSTEQAKLEKDGWVQAIRTNGEFIVNSWVVAKEKADASKGVTYDTSDHNTYQDPATGLFWRSTGFFD